MMGPMVRWAVAAIACATMASVGCGKKKSTPALPGDAGVATRSPASAGDAGAAAPAPVAAPARVPTRVELRTYRHHLNTGRKLAAADDWAKAAAHFEAALVLEPDSARALSELSWAALQLDDLETARRAAEQSVVLAHDPRLEAASLYNLGRALEAGGDEGAALFSYERSLRLRPNHIVQQRYEALGGDAILRMPAPPCAEAAPAAEVCACLARIAAVTPERSQCTEAPVDGEASLTLITHIALDESGERGRTTFYLARRRAKVLEVVATLAHGFHGPLSIDGFTVGAVTREPRDGRTVVRIDGVLETGDADTMMIVERSRERRVTFCLETSEAIACPVSITAAGEWLARLGAADPSDAEVLGWFRDDYKAAPPVSWTYEVAIEVGDDGTVTATSGTGQRAYRATYRLW